METTDREDCTLAAWYRSIYAPRTGGAHGSHHRTAGTAGRTRRRDCRVAARGAPRPPVLFALLRCFTDFAREAERRLHRLMIMDHRGLVAAKDRVRLGPGSQPDL